MSYPVAFSSLAVLAWVAAVVWPVPAVQLLLFWWGFGMAWAALAYGGLGARAIGKNSEGQLPWWSWVGITSFLLFHRVSLSLLHQVGSEAEANEIVPGVWLGRRPSRRNRWLSRLPVGAVLDCTAELPKPSSIGDQAYLALPILDARAPSAEQIDEGIEFLKTHLQSGVLVHCALGHGRSASLVAAWLLHQGLARSVAEAELFIQQKRPSVSLSRWQRRELALWHAREVVVNPPALAAVS